MYFKTLTIHLHIACIFTCNTQHIYLSNVMYSYTQQYIKKNVAKISKLFL